MPSRPSDSASTGTWKWTRQVSASWKPAGGFSHQVAGTNLRFVVTNLPVTSDEQAEQRYDDDIQRGESEQRFDELKNGLEMGRLSCHRFMANFWRLLLHVAAYNWLNAFRDAAETPAELRHAQPAKWRTKLFKVAAKIVTSTRRVFDSLAALAPVRSHV